MFYLHFPIEICFLIVYNDVTIGKFLLIYTLGGFIMKDITLVVMAAGMGSRFGGLKQIEPIGPNGEVILDFSVYDAVKAGFDKAVFIIRKDIEKDFREMAGKRIEKMVDVEYVFQDMNNLPDGFSAPSD